MKKTFLLLAFFLLASGCFSQSFREAILNADAIVVGRNIYPAKDKNIDYGLSKQAVLVHHYAKSTGEGTLPLVVCKDGLLEAVEVAEEGCYDTWRCLSASLYCLKKYGDSYSVLYRIPVDLVNSQKCKTTEESVNDMLRIAQLTDEKERFDQTAAWLVKTYSDGIDELELSEYSSFIRYYKAKGYINDPIDVLTDEQKIFLSDFLLKKTSWDRSDIKIAELLKEYISSETLEQRLIEYLLDYPNKRFLYVWDIRPAANLLNTIDPSLAEPYTINTLESTIDLCERDHIQEFVDNVYSQWKESRNQQEVNE